MSELYSEADQIIIIDDGDISLSTQHTRQCTVIHEMKTSYANSEQAANDHAANKCHTKGGLPPNFLASSDIRLIARAFKASVDRLSRRDAISDLKIAVDTSIEHSSAQIADALTSEVMPSMVFIQDHISLAGRLTAFPGDLVVMIKQITECAFTYYSSFVLIPLTSGRCQCCRLA